MAFEVELIFWPLPTFRYLENCLLHHLSIFLWLLLELAAVGSVSILLLMDLMLINHVCLLPCHVIYTLYLYLSVAIRC